MTGNGGGPGILYWPTAKAFIALGRPVPDHPAYRYDLLDDRGAVSPPERSRVQRRRRGRRGAQNATQVPQNRSEGTAAS